MNGKIVLAATCAISLSTGYVIRGGINVSGEETKTSATPSRPDRPSTTKTRTRPMEDNALLDSILGSRPISEIPPADLAALIARLYESDIGMDPVLRAKQSYQLQLLLAKLPPANLAAIASSILSDPETKGSGYLTYILISLAKKDRERALDWVSHQEDSSHHYSVVIGAIAMDDPLVAADLFNQGLLDGRLSENDSGSARYNIAHALARIGAEPLVKFIDSLPQRSQTVTIQSAMQSIPEGERIKLLDEIHLRKPGIQFREVGLNKLFSEILSSDEPSAKEWFAKLPEGSEKDNLRFNAAKALINSGEKGVATTWLRESLATIPGREKGVLATIIDDVIHNNSGDIPHYAALLPEGLAFTAKDLEIYRPERTLYRHWRPHCHCLRHSRSRRASPPHCHNP